jgi:hypothetical protein
MLPDRFADHVHVRPWTDAVVDDLGFPPGSWYVEWYWLSILGPTSVWLLRRVDDALEHAPDGFLLDINECAAALGIAGSTGRTSAIQRTLRRIVQFGAARAVDAQTLDVRRHLPPLTRAQVARLPSSLRAAHDEWSRDELQRHQLAKSAG